MNCDDGAAALVNCFDAPLGAWTRGAYVAPSGTICHSLELTEGSQSVPSQSQPPLSKVLFLPFRDFFHFTPQLFRLFNSMNVKEVQYKYFTSCRIFSLSITVCLLLDYITSVMAYCGLYLPAQISSQMFSVKYEKI